MPCNSSSYRRRRLFRSISAAALLGFTILFFGGMVTQAQTATLTTLASNVPEPNNGVMQATDGNYYSTTPPEVQKYAVPTVICV